MSIQEEGRKAIMVKLAESTGEYRLELIARCLRGDIAGKKVLDLGCGSGIVSRWFLRKGCARVVGVDLQEPLIDHESWAFRELNLNTSDWSANLREGKNGGSFDVLVAFDIIEHLEAPGLFLDNCERLLADNGLLFLSTPNTASWERFTRPESWSGAADPQHRILFNSYSLSFLLSKCGFQIQMIRAPIRKLGGVANILPWFGGQLFVSAKPCRGIVEHSV